MVSGWRIYEESVVPRMSMFGKIVKVLFNGVKPIFLNNISE